MATERVVLVTGVSRDLGARFARVLAAEEQIEVVGLDVVPPRHDLGRADFVRADIRNPFIAKVIADAAAEGLIQRHNPTDESAEAAEPLADWERELLEEGAPEQSSAETEKVADEAIAEADLAEAVTAEQSVEGEAATETADDAAGAEAHDEAIAAAADEPVAEVADAETAAK